MASITASRERRLGLEHPALLVAAVVAAAVLLVALAWLYVDLAARQALTSDDANSVLQAYDMAHGNPALAGWWASDVSFLTTELPIYAAFTVVSGISPTTVHRATAAIYVAILVLGMLVASRGLKRPAKAAAALITLAVLVAPSSGAGWGPAGGANYTAGNTLLRGPDHTGTAGFLLLAILILGGDRPGWLRTAFYTALLGLTVAGDPQAAYLGALPIAAAYAVLGLQRREAQMLLPVVASVVAIALGLGIDHAVAAGGGLQLVPRPPHFASAAAVLGNLANATESVLVLFGADFFSQPVNASLLVIGLHLSAVIAVAACVVVVLRRRLDAISTALAAIVAADFVELVFSTLDVTAGRYLVPTLVVGAALLGRTVGPAVSKWRLGASAAAAAAAIAVLFLGVGPLGPILEHRHLVPARSTVASGDPYAGLGSWLASRHLTYGLGNYWDASIITLDTHGAVRVRAVWVTSRLQLAPMIWESKPAWYRPGQSGAQATFVIVDPTGLFGVTTAEAVAVFGPAARVLTYGSFTVLVWDRDLLPLLAPPQVYE